MYLHAQPYKSILKKRETFLIDDQKIRSNISCTVSMDREVVCAIIAQRVKLAFQLLLVSVRVHWQLSSQCVIIFNPNNKNVLCILIQSLMLSASITFFFTRKRKIQIKLTKLTKLIPLKCNDFFRYKTMLHFLSD